MSCSGCSSGRGCNTASVQLQNGCRSKGAFEFGSCSKLNVFDWLSDVEIPDRQSRFDGIEARFKNTRKDFFRNVNHLSLKAGDVVAVEASPGHDIGTVSLTGELVRMRMEKKNLAPDSLEIKKVYRVANQSDITKWKEAQALERPTMLQARTIAKFLKLEMKISDVEYQGDKSKAIFYYTAEGRVDFRQLIKEYAAAFRVRIEMKQVTLRYEAGRLGGIGDCGKELCCSNWLTDFRAVNTTSARHQQLSLNPIKLTGQCGKLKCCLNYELDSYLDALKDFPESEIKLETKKGIAVHQKTDIFRRLLWYAYEDDRNILVPLPVERVKEIIAMNKAGKKPEELKTK